MSARWMRRICHGIGLLALSAAAGEAGTYGVPTNLTAAGATQASSVNPPGFFNLDGTANGFDGGDGVHQLRLKIEVTGTTLDVRIYDPGSSGSRDIGNGGAVTTTRFTLLDPSGATITTLLFGNDNVTTDNRLVRLTPPCGAPPNSCGFVALNDVSANARDFSAANGVAISPGLYELRIATTNATTETNAFGVDIRAGRNNAAHYNVFTLASDDGSTGAPGHRRRRGDRLARRLGQRQQRGPERQHHRAADVLRLRRPRLQRADVELRYGLPRQRRRRRQRRDPRRPRSHDRADDEPIHRARRERRDRGDDDSDEPDGRELRHVPGDQQHGHHEQRHRLARLGLPGRDERGRERAGAAREPDPDVPDRTTTHRRRGTRARRHPSSRSWP